MTYATQQDLIDRFGETEIIQISDRANVGEIGATEVAKALADADVEIDGYLAGRYTLPFVSPPKVLQLIASDIARYRLYEPRVTEEVQKRYDRWIKFLEQVAAGKVSFGLDESGAQTGTSGGPTVDAGDRVFTPGTLEDF